MPFDFLTLIRQYRVPFREQGKNVSRGWIGIKCPFCGPRDSDMHMGIELMTGRWHCWRDDTHGGARPERLIVALTRCTWEHAHTMVTGNAMAGTLDEIAEKAAKLFERRKVEPVKLEHLEYPPEIRPINLQFKSSRRFVDYLVDERKYPWDHIPELLRTYAMRGAVTGRFANRLILPFWIKGNRVGWTGRAVGDAETRYLSHPDSSAVKSILFNYDIAAGGGQTLVIVEGPLDTTRVDFYTHPSVSAVGVLGTAITEVQIGLLRQLAYRYDETVILLDADAVKVAMDLQSKLAIIRPKIKFLPPRVKDPGLLSPEQVLTLFPWPRTGRLERV